MNTLQTVNAEGNQVHTIWQKKETIRFYLVKVQIHSHLFKTVDFRPKCMLRYILFKRVSMRWIRMNNKTLFKETVL